MEQQMQQLYEKDSSEAYRNLQQMEVYSETYDGLYPYLPEFIAMLKSEKYVVRVRGFRLLCKQARWDTEKKIDQQIDEILCALDDEKPTAVRQALAALKELAVYKPELHAEIRHKVQAIHIISYKDTMQGLIEKDMAQLMKLVAEHSPQSAK